MEGKKYQSKRTQRKISVVGDEGEYRYFYWDDDTKICHQWKIDLWDRMFEEVRS